MSGFVANGEEVQDSSGRLRVRVEASLSQFVSSPLLIDRHDPMGFEVHEAEALFKRESALLESQVVLAKIHQNRQ